MLIGTAGAATTRLVPVARAVEHGNELRVPYDRAFIEEDEDDAAAVAQLGGWPPEG